MRWVPPRTTLNTLVDFFLRSPSLLCFSACVLSRKAKSFFNLTRSFYFTALCTTEHLCKCIYTFTFLYSPKEIFQVWALFKILSVCLEIMLVSLKKLLGVLGVEILCTDPDVWNLHICLGLFDLDWCMCSTEQNVTHEPLQYILCLI